MEISKDRIEKQAIEEMAKVIETTEQIARDAHCGFPSTTMYAKDLYWKCYRKQKWISVDERLRIIDEQPTADVVPNSEVENYKQIAEYQQKLAMDRYFEIKRLQEDVDRLQDINNRQVEDVRLAKQEVAREIFAEIEELAKIYTFPVVKNGFVEIAKEPFWCIEPSDLAELKKKYTGETDNES